MKRPESFPRPVHFATFLLALTAEAASASAPVEHARTLFDVTPERVASFQAALREFTGTASVDSIGSDGLWLRSTYGSTVVGVADADPDELGMTVGDYGRDLATDEAFLIEGRERNFRDTARRWVERELKGSDARGASPARSSWRLKGAWDDGPIVGVGRGPFSFRVGENEWQARVSWAIDRLPGWHTSFTVEEEDGDERVAFSIGRSLRAALTRPR